MAGNIKGITIEINGDTTGLSRALREVDSALKETQSQLTAVEKGLKLDPGNADLLRDKFQLMKDRISETKDRLDTLKEAQRQMDASGVDKNSEQYRALQTEINTTSSKLKGLEKDMKSFGSVGKQQLQAVCDKAKEVGEKLSDAGKKMTKKVSAPIVGGFTAAVKTAADFDAQMSKVQAISGASAQETEKLTEKAREMGASTKFSATEAGQALEYMAMAGWKTDDMISGLDGIMNLAAASGEELGTTSDIVTDALTAFGMSAEESGRFADILAAAASNANTNVSMMGASFKYVAPVAGSLGYTAEDVAVALGLMANSGIKADMAGTSLRNMFQRMALPTKTSQMALDRLGLSLADDEGNMYSLREIMDQLRGSFSEINMSAEEYDKRVADLDKALEDGTLSQTKYDAALEELNKQAFGAEGAEKARAAAMLGGTRAMSGLLAIANTSVEDYNKLTAAVDGSSESFAKLADGSIVPLNDALAQGQEVIEQYNGSAQAMAETMQNNLSGDVTELLSMLQELAISLGELLMPLLRDVVEDIKGIVDWLNSLDDGTKKAILIIAGVVAAIGPILIVVGKLITAISTIVSVVSAAGPAIAAIGAVLSGPVGIILAIIAALTALGIAIYANWDKIKAFCADVKDGFNRLKEDVKQNWEQLKTDTANKWNEIKSSVKDKVTEAANTVKEKWNGLKDTTAKVWGAMKDKVNENGGGIKGIVKTYAEGWQNIIKFAWNTADKATGGALSNMLTSVIDKAKDIKENIENKIGEAVDFIKNLPSQALQWGKDLISNFIEGIKNAPSDLANAASGIAGTIADFLHFSEPDKGPLKDFHTFAPDMVRLFAQGMEQTLPVLERASADFASSLVPGAMQNSGGATTTYNTPVNITVYGAEGQDVNALADVIQARLNREVMNQKAVFA